MPLRHLGFVDLPAHARAGGFDHAAVHEPTGRIYVAHTANDAVDVIDVETRTYVGSIHGPDGGGRRARRVRARSRLHVEPRREHGRRLPPPTLAPRVDKIAVGMRPNGLAYDPRRGRLLVAHVGDPAVPRLVHGLGRRRPRPEAHRRRPRGRAARAGPSTIRSPTPSTSTSPTLRRSSSSSPAIRSASDACVSIPHAGPHGLDIDSSGAASSARATPGCCSRSMPTAARSSAAEPIAGVPDVVFFNAAPGPPLRRDRRPRRHRGVRHGAAPASRDDSPPKPARTRCRFDAARNIVCAFLPASHRAAVYEDPA